MNKKDFYILLLVGVFITLALFSFKYYQNFQSQKTKQASWPTKQDQAELVAEIKIPDFSQNQIIALENFDISNWQTFQDLEIGLKFKYPPEWGQPVKNLISCIEACSEDEKTPAYSYSLEFTNSKFRVGGGSKNWNPSRGQSILYDFRGFQKKTAIKFCQTPWLIDCQIKNNRLFYTSSLACRGEPGSGFDFERVMLIDVLDGNKISGLAFGGDFISTDLDLNQLNACKPAIKNQINQAILDRKLDQKSMNNFDLYDQVFETVEIF